MILPDANILLYAVNVAAPQHQVALRAMQEGFATPRGVGFAWLTLLAFLRLSTRLGVFPRPLTVDDALRVISNWLHHPSAQVIQPGERHAELLGRLLRAAGTAGNLTCDAHLAALAIEHDARIVSFNRDFARFADVSWAHPS
jgi:uncharacterized protein